MKKPTRNKIFFWMFKGGGICLSAAMPLWVVLDKFPMWVETHGAGRSLGAGGILGIMILLVIFRKTIMGYITEKYSVKHTPPMTIWIVCLAIAYSILYLAKFLYDLTLVLWMGLFGSITGTLLTFAGETLFGEGDDK